MNTLNTVYCSYSKKDTQKVLQIKWALASEGYTVYMSPLADDVTSKKIAAESIARADILFVNWNKHAADTAHVRWEIDHFIKVNPLAYSRISVKSDGTPFPYRAEESPLFTDSISLNALRRKLRKLKKRKKTGKSRVDLIVQIHNVESKIKNLQSGKNNSRSSLRARAGSFFKRPYSTLETVSIVSVLFFSLFLILHVLSLNRPTPPTTQSIISINNPTAHESDGKIPFTITVEPPSPKEIQVAYSSDAVSADFADFENKTGELTILPDQKNSTIWVPLIDDDVFEKDERFSMSWSLLSPIDRTISDTAGVGYAEIIDDDLLQLADFKRITSSTCVSKFLVSRSEFDSPSKIIENQAVIKTNRLHRMPVSEKSWYQATRYIANLNADYSARGYIFRLPTADELEMHKGSLDIQYESLEWTRDEFPGEPDNAVALGFVTPDSPKREKYLKSDQSDNLFFRLALTGNTEVCLFQ